MVFMVSTLYHMMGCCCHPLSMIQTIKSLNGIYFPRNLKLKIPNIPDFQPNVFAVPSPECGLWLLKHFGCSMNIFNETVKNLEQGVKNVSPQLFT